MKHFHVNFSCSESRYMTLYRLMSSIQYLTVRRYAKAIWCILKVLYTACIISPLYTACPTTTPPPPLPPLTKSTFKRLVKRAHVLQVRYLNNCLIYLGVSTSEANKIGVIGVIWKLKLYPFRVTSCSLPFSGHIKWCFENLFIAMPNPKWWP